MKKVKSEMYKVVLKYVGDGKWVPNAPKRDLTPHDLVERDLDEKSLVESGLYEYYVEPEKAKKDLTEKVSEKESETWLVEEND